MVNPHLDIFELANKLQVVEDDSYLLSYPHILNYFKTKEKISEADFVCGAHMVYGWMPTIVELYLTNRKTDLKCAANLLTKAKKEGRLEVVEIEKLASIVNNSLVGTSKLLHFVAPHAFAIWDSKVYSFVNGKKPHHYQVRDVKLYVEYLETLNKYQSDDRFDGFHKIVNDKLGYNVSKLRAIEVVMFQNSGLLAY